MQFRITGKAYTVSEDKSTASKTIEALHLADGAEESDPNWWEEKRKQVWENEMSGHLRGSFGRPGPGTPLSEVKEKPEDWIERLDASSVSLPLLRSSRF